MANLIITVIAIALVAIASLMGAYYGGAAFLNNQSAANASTVLNGAQQLVGAWNAYLSDNLSNQPTNLGQLVTGGYLSQIPPTPAAPGNVNASTMAVAAVNNAALQIHYYAYADLGAPGNTDTPTGGGNFAACYHVIKTAIGPTAAAALAAIPNLPASSISANNGVSGNGTFGCALMQGQPAAMNGSAGVTAGHYVMEYLIQ